MRGGRPGRSTASSGRGGRRHQGASPQPNGGGSLRSVDGETSEGEVLLQLRSADVSFARIRRGDLVWRSLDATLEGRLRSTYESKADADRRRVPVAVSVSGGIGEPLTLEMRDPDGHRVSVATVECLVAAEIRPMDEHVLRKTLGKTLGGGVLALGTLDLAGLHLEAGLYLAPSEVKEARRQAVDKMIAARRFHGRAEGMAEGSVLKGMLGAVARASAEASGRPEPSGSTGTDIKRRFTIRHKDPPRVHLLCRSQEQVAAAMEVPWLEEVVLDFLEVHGLQLAVQQVQAAGKRAVVATPRILKPDEQRLSSYFLRLGADAMLIRSTGMLQVLEQAGGEGAWVDSVGVHIPPLLGDFSLNAANTLTADALLGSGLQRLTPTHDLNAQQIATMAKRLGERGAALEVVLHQHLPIFHMEHCVFCRFLSAGNSYRDCGHPCELNTVHLRDSEGKDHLVLADMGCRNTVFNAQAQSGIHYIDTLVGAGVRQFRVELVDEPPELVAPLLEGYAAVLRGEQSPDQLWGWLQTVPDANGNAHGTTRGSLGVHKERSSRKMKPTAASLR